MQGELEAAFLPLLAAHRAAGEAAKLRPSIAFDSANNALWVKIPKNSGKAAERALHECTGVGTASVP